jgi:endoglucanase
MGCSNQTQEIAIQSGHKYTVKFSVKANKATKIYAKIGDMGEPYGECWNNKWNAFSLQPGQTLDVSDTLQRIGIIRLLSLRPPWW